MKRFILLFLVFLGVSACFAKSDSPVYEYDIVGVAVAKDGYYLVEVSAMVDKKKDATVDIAKKCAIHGCLFKGFVLPRNAQKPIMASPSEEQAHAEYFDKLINEQFSAYTNSASPAQIVEVGKRYRVKAVIAVAKEALRKDLEKAGIVKSLADSAGSQSKKPKIMVVPMDTWCQERGFWNVYENQGEIKGSPNYEQAVQDSRELMLVISKINSLMSNRGYTLADLSQSIKNNTRRTARNTLTTSKTSGSSLAVSALDELNRQAKADIIVEVDFSYNSIGPKHSVTYNLRALDAYTGKQVANAEGTGAPTFTSEIPVLLEEAVVGHMDNFISSLQSHFDDCSENGREVVIEIGVFDNGSGIDLENEYDGTELSEIIENWVAENTVNHQFLTSETTESIMLFENVRIPLQKENGMPQDASGFANELRKYLRTKYGIESKNNSPSLGYAQIIIGEK